MANGSVTWRNYTASIPTGTDFAIQIDESNSLAEYNGLPLFVVPTTLSAIQAPKTLTKRYILAELADNPRIKRRFYVGTAALWQQIASDPTAQIQAAVGSDPTDATVGPIDDWVVTFAGEEKYSRRPRLRDSGLIDGTPND